MVACDGGADTSASNNTGSGVIGIGSGGAGATNVIDGGANGSSLVDASSPCADAVCIATISTACLLESVGMNFPNIHNLTSSWSVEYIWWDQ